MTPQLAAVATLLAFTPHGNRIEFRLDRGSAELTWLSPSTFHFRRTLEGSLPAANAGDRPAVAVQIDDQPDAVRLRSKFLDVAIAKHGVLVRVRKLDGTPLLEDLSAGHRRAPAAARFYGLGPRTGAGLDARGQSIQTRVPFLISTTGYGEYHAMPGPYRFDFTTPDRYSIDSPAIDWFFYYGPGIKQIFEEHRNAQGPSPGWAAATENTGSWDTLRATLLRLVHGSMSAQWAPALSLAPYAGKAPDLIQRARQLGSLVDDVSPGAIGLSDFRKQLETFFLTYAAEANMKGYPIWHPLPFQFPDDPECARHADEFMLGDEMLIAPIVQSGNRRSLYLPQGNWTNLATNELQPGRRTITVDTPELPVFARNGTIIPLDSAGGIALHYFPTIAAEFFLAETNPDDWTQIHAAPAADVMRLEIESRKTRDYLWVVHHVEKPVDVGFAGKTVTTWSYDATRKNLQVRVHVKEGEDSIVNITF